MCLGGVCDSVQIAIHSKTLIHKILSLVRSGFEPDVESPNERPKNFSGSGFWELHPNLTHIFPVNLEVS